MQLQPGAKIVVLEAARLAEGTAGRNSGFMIDLPHDLTSGDYAGQDDGQAMIAQNLRAIAFGRAAVGDYGIDANYFDPTGKVNGAASDIAHKHKVSYGAHLSALGEPFELLDRQQMRDLTGSPLYVSGLYTPGTVNLQPAGYIRGLGAGMRNHVSLFENSPVTGFARTGADWRVATAQGSVTTHRVILTTNGHLDFWF